MIWLLVAYLAIYILCFALTFYIEWRTMRNIDAPFNLITTDDWAFIAATSVLFAMIGPPGVWVAWRACDVGGPGKAPRLWRKQ